MVEHHNGIVGVRGSNPLGSTILRFNNLRFSASSKTAYGAAFCLMDEASVKLIGLTSPGNQAFVRGLGCYFGVEIGGHDPTGFADRLLYRCLAKGLSFKLGSGVALDAAPPRKRVPPPIKNAPAEIGPPAPRAR